VREKNDPAKEESLMAKKPSEEEEKYFKEAEIERRKKAELQAELAQLTDKEAASVAEILNIEDMELARELVNLGFASDTVGIFPLLPLVYVAWADGEVSLSERRRVLEIAQERGARRGSPGYNFLEKLLDAKPKDAFFEVCIATIKKIFSNRPDGSSDSTDLVSLSLSVAEASGGLLGLFGNKVSDEERQVLKDMVSALNADDSDGMRQLLDAIKD
jgi:tellurite resistance protein